MTKSSGFIITDNERIIHGSGDTVEAAWADAEYTFGCAGVELLDDDADTDAQLGNWTMRSGLRVVPATAELLDAIDQDGGLVVWTLAGGVATTA